MLARSGNFKNVILTPRENNKSPQIESLLIDLYKVFEIPIVAHFKMPCIPLKVINNVATVLTPII